MKKISLIISLIFTSVTGILTSCSEDYPGPDPVDVTANYSNKFSNPNPTLTLVYNGENMTGKSVDFSTVKGETANLTFYDILPGEKALKLDLNQVYLQQLQSMGSTGEYMIMGSVCNTFLDAYGCNKIQVTTDGQEIVTGHAEYPGYNGKFE